MSADRHDEIERRLTELERQIVVFLGHGNHQGRLAAMSSQIDKHEERLSTLEHVRWRLAGAVTLAGSATGIVLFIIDKVMR